MRWLALSLALLLSGCYAYGPYYDNSLGAMVDRFAEQDRQYWVNDRLQRLEHDAFNRRLGIDPLGY